VHMVFNCGMRNGRAVRPEPSLNSMTKKASADKSAVRDRPPYQLIHSAIRDPHSAIDF
jgi:hypothetical protein